MTSRKSSSRNFRIQTLTAYVAIDPADNSEGIIGQLMPDGVGGMSWMPFIGADEDRIRSMRPMAERLARDLAREVKLVRFSTREDVETIDGAS
jgi:hypothetical protein